MNKFLVQVPVLAGLIFALSAAPAETTDSGADNDTPVVASDDAPAKRPVVLIVELPDIYTDDVETPDVAADATDKASDDAEFNTPIT